MDCLISIVFMVAIGIVSVVCSIQSASCSNKNCMNVNFNYDRPPLDILINKTKSIGYIYSLENLWIPVQSIIVTRYTSFCSVHLFSSNVGCNNNYVESNIEYTKEQVLEIISTRLYPVGETCVDGGSCTGALASSCGDPLPFTKRVAVCDYAKTVGAWENVMHDTCKQYFSCQMRESAKMVRTKMVEGSRVYYIEVEGIQLEVDFHEASVHYVKGIAIYIPKQLEKATTSEFECLNDENTKICISTTDSKMFKRGQVFFLDSENNHHGDGYFLKIPGMGKLATDDQFSKYLANVNSTVSASLADLSKLCTMLLFENLQGRFNAIRLLDGQNKLHDLIVRIIKASASSNEYFLGAFLGLDGVNMWINQKDSVVCPCKKKSLNMQSNCVGKYVLKRGQLWLKEESDLCVFNKSRKVIAVKLNQDDLGLSLEGLTVTKFDGVEEAEITKETALPGSTRDTPDIRGFEINGNIFSWVTGIIDSAKSFSWIASYVSLYLCTKILMRGNH